MKYLFFFNGQPLLLCCVCCKIAIQDFLTGLHKKIRKIYGFTDGYTNGYNPSVFHRELQNNYVIVPQSPTDYNPSIFHRELQKNYVIVPRSPTELPTEYNPSVFHRELQNNYGIVPPSPTVLPTSTTDGITDGFTHIPKRTHV
jgi:hypothetical protein